MFRRILLVAVTAALLLPIAALAGGKDPFIRRVGAPVKVKQAVNIAALKDAPEQFSGRTVRLEGTVADVCQGRGCWVEVVDATGASFMARSLDESVLLPKNCKGWHVVVQGKVMALPAKVRNEAEPADHACPKPEYVVSTAGVELTPAPVDSPLPQRATSR
jgi:hypothetical protein